MGLDGAVAGGVGHAGQHETSFDLVIVEEALIALVNGASGDLAGAGGASASAAGIGEVDALLFSSIEDVLVVGDFDGLVQAFAFRDEGDLVGRHGNNRCSGPRQAGPVGRPSCTPDQGLSVPQAGQGQWIIEHI